MPLTALSACGSAFTPGNSGDDASMPNEAGDDAVDDIVVIIHHDAGPDSGHDATTGDAAEDGTADAHEDAKNDGPSDASDGGTGCPTGYLTCGGQCVPDDVKNCGTCGHDCTNLPHVSGMTSCTSGACSFPPSACAPGWADCDGNPDDGCETNITVPAHCGSCTTVCPVSDPQCQGSGSTYTCVTGCSGSTPTLCGGSCANTTDDPTNCGSCGHDCTGAPKNAQNTCVSSACSYSCNAGYTGCSGACVNESNDPSHCGSCTTACGAPTNGQATCANSTCGFVCEGGYLKCGAGCIVAVPDPTHGVFVAQGGGTSSSCGTELLPCGTITAALTVVSQSVGARTIVYVDDKSTLTEPGPVTLPAGVTIEGGWVDNAGTWAADCNPAQLPVIQPQSGFVTISASYSGTSTLRQLVIESKSTASPGESLYGVFASGSSTALVLDSVSVVVAAAGPGKSGAAGGNGTNGSTAGCSTSGTGANGTAGSLGSAGAGAYSSSGFTPTAAGQGQAGQSGQAGTAPTPPQCSDGCTTSCTWVSGDGACEACGGNTNQICGTPGLSGCGGTGSGGGLSGSNGGVSIGVFAYGASVTITNGVVKTGMGGKGGDGGAAGSTAGVGAAGVAGSSVCLNKSCTGTSPTTCHLGGCGASVSGGSAGGAGGNGGLGGQGGGGAGGDSYCVVYGGGGAVSAPGLACTPSSGGPGGAPNGASGHAGTTKTF